MAHYAFLDENNIVVEVITGRDENDLVEGVSNWETHYGSLRGQVCKRTSYNSNIRKNYAGLGYFYDEVRDAFIPVKLDEVSTWVLNENTCQWERPIPYPNDNKKYGWDEENQQWVQTPGIE